MSPSMVKNKSFNSDNISNENPKKCLFEENNKGVLKEKKIKKEILSEKEFKETDLNEGISKSSDFKRIGFIGQGSSGIVEKALYVPKNMIVALKVKQKNIVFYKSINFHRVFL